MVKLTKEEKKAKKEANVLEKLKEATEAQRKAKRDELQREIVAQAARKGILNKSWKNLMIKIKEPVFRQDIEVMWHVFERACDKKNEVIKYTRHLSNVADDQFQRTMSSFVDTIDTLINKYLNDLEEILRVNKTKTAALLKYDESCTNKMLADHNAAETHLQLLLFHAHKTYEDFSWTTLGENLVKEEDDHTKKANERDLLRSKIEHNYTAIWENFKFILKSYVTNTAENQKQLRKLRRKENEMADIIASQGKRIRNNDGLLKRLRSELAAYESGKMQAVFRENRNKHRDACMNIKEKLYSGLATDEQQLSTLVKYSDDALDWLKAAHVKCDKIIRIAALCRKYETQHEKIAPYGINNPHSSDEMKMFARRQRINDPIVGKAILSTCGMTRLWQRIARVQLIEKALLREKKLLIEENATLERHLRKSEDKNHNFNLNSDTCICYAPETVEKNNIMRPNAIEGALEVSKFVHKNTK